MSKRNRFHGLYLEPEPERCGQEVEATRQREWQVKFDAAVKEHPNACHACYGAGYTPWTPEDGDWEPCETCLTQNKCARCAGLLLPTLTVCMFCGWDSEAEPPTMVLPPRPEVW